MHFLHILCIMPLDALLTQEGELMKLRALGYSQNDIAKSLGTTQSTISRRMDTIRKQAQGNSNDDNTFWKLLIGLGAVYLIAKIVEEVE